MTWYSDANVCQVQKAQLCATSYEVLFAMQPDHSRTSVSQHLSKALTTRESSSLDFSDAAALADARPPVCMLANHEFCLPRHVRSSCQHKQAQ